MPGVYSKKALIAIGGMFLFGTGTMVAAKMMLLESAVGKHADKGEKDFEKPWYQTTIMFFAMSICILWHLVNVSIEKKVHSKKERLLSGEDSTSAPAPKNDPKAYFYIAIPALFDLLATTVMTYGLVYIDVSVMQMLRGSMVVFSAILSVVVLKRKLFTFNWIGVCFAVFACACVGTSAVMGASDDGNRTASERLFGCTLVVISQFIQAMQIVSEDLLLHNINAAPLQIVGMEGVWGALLCLTVFLPGAYFLNGSDNGHMEDTWDTIAMVKNNSSILATSAVYFVSILFLNYAGMTVTSELTAVHRTMFEALRTLMIWLTDMSINYFILPNTVFGEAWNAWSPLQTAGFLTLIFSTFFYNGMVRYSNFKYPADQQVPKEESSA